MIIEYRKPSSALAPFVDHLWEKQVEEGGVIPYDIETIFPEDQTVLTYSFGKEYYRSHATVENFEAINGVQLEGLHQAPNFYKHQPGIHIFGVKFRVGGLFAFLPSPISETNNRSSDADTLLTELPSLDHTINFDQRCETIEAYLLKNILEKQAKKYLKLLLMLQELDADSSAMPSSYKTLSRLFQEVIGISPKEYVQIKRINQSLALFASSKDIKSQDLADQLGYYDSAHFINEFKKYTGKTPKSLKNSLFDMKDSEFIDEFKQYISPEHLLHYTSIFHKNS
ncbi:helix-turn-helix domain-containing protein [Aquirufa sp. HETE-83D]|uniref:Helix-turn-helix domain-containing protein n=1 Tax=Aquirufa esocilacus TaxID=3096513 RepID=A0ABW6DJT9_9BACT